MFCPNCGTGQADNAAFCQQCGSSLSGTQTPTAPPYAQAPSAANINTYMTPAILVTLFCCMPLGVAAIFKANAAKSAINKGDIQTALQASQTAKTLCWVSFACGLLFLFIAIASNA